MFYTSIILPLILWLLALVTSTTVGGLVHVLLVLAIAALMVRVLPDRQPL